MRARKAVEASRSAEGDDASRLEQLLEDIRTVCKGKIEMPSVDLVKSLLAIEGRPWAELGKSRKPLTQNKLARMLKGPGLNIAPKDVRTGGCACSRIHPG